MSAFRRAVEEMFRRPPRDVQDALATLASLPVDAGFDADDTSRNIGYGRMVGEEKE